MPKSEVRAAIANYLDPVNSSITYLGSVYQALPQVANESDLFYLQPAGQGIGAVIYVFIESQLERRIAMDGPHNGRKLRPYELALLCILKSDLASSLGGQVAFDTFIDSLTAYIEADRNAGDPAVIFSWGEGEAIGAPDLHFQYPVPKTSKGGVTLFQAVGRVTVLEILNT